MQTFQPDSFFSKKQHERLSQLMERWRMARDAGIALAPAEQSELQLLVDQESSVLPGLLSLFILACSPLVSNQFSAPEL